MRHERDGKTSVAALHRVACCKGYRLCNTYAKLHCCRKSQRRQTESERGRQRQTIEQSCLSVFSQSGSAPAPASASVAASYRCRWRRQQKQCENPLLRLIGHQDYWVGNGNGNGGYTLGSSLFFYLFCFFFFFMFISSSSRVSVSFERAPHRTNLLGNLCSAPRRIHFCLQRTAEIIIFPSSKCRQLFYLIDPTPLVCPRPCATLCHA